MTLDCNYKMYPVDVDKRTGESLTLHRHNRGPRENFATVYTIHSPIKGQILQVRIDDHQHSQFMAW